MVAKVRLGRNFGQTVRYLFEGRKTEQQKRVDKKAEILGSNGIRRGTIAQITADFQRQQSLNPDLNVVAWHAALSFSEDDQDRLSNDTMLRLALLYMTNMGIDPKKTQWLLVRHRDREHPHAHLLINRVKANGGTISTAFCNGRSRAVAVGIAQQEQLTVSVTKDNPKKQVKWQKESPWKKAKRSVYKALAQLIPKVGSLSDLTQRLQEQSIEVLTYPAKIDSEADIRGITFIYDHQHIKGSQADKTFGWPRLKKTLNGQKSQLQVEHQETVHPVQAPTKQPELKEKPHPDKPQPTLPDKPTRKKRPKPKVSG